MRSHTPTLLFVRSYHRLGHIRCSSLLHCYCCYITNTRSIVSDQRRSLDVDVVVVTRTLPLLLLQELQSRLLFLLLLLTVSPVEDDVPSCDPLADLLFNIVMSLLTCWLCACSQMDSGDIVKLVLTPATQAADQWLVSGFEPVRTLSASRYRLELCQSLNRYVYWLELCQPLIGMEEHPTLALFIYVV